MSGGTKPHQLRYYQEQFRKIEELKTDLERRAPGTAEQILTAARNATEELIDEGYLQKTPKEKRGAMYGLFYDLLLEVENGDTKVSEAAEAKARKLGIEDDESIQIARELADVHCDVVVTMERDHYDTVDGAPASGDDELGESDWND